MSSPDSFNHWLTALETIRYAKEHFKRVNELQKEQKYYFKFLSPSSYDLFFQALREKMYREFKSELEAKLEAS